MTPTIAIMAVPASRASIWTGWGVGFKSGRNPASDGELIATARPLTSSRVLITRSPRGPSSGEGGRRRVALNAGDHDASTTSLPLRTTRRSPPASSRHPAHPLQRRSVQRADLVVSIGRLRGAAVRGWGRGRPRPYRRPRPRVLHAGPMGGRGRRFAVRLGSSKPGRTARARARALLRAPAARRLRDDGRVAPSTFLASVAPTLDRAVRPRRRRHLDSPARLPTLRSMAYFARCSVPRAPGWSRTPPITRTPTPISS